MVPTRELAELVEHVQRADGEARAGRRSPPAAGARGRRRVPRPAHAAAVIELDREPPAGGASGSATRCALVRDGAAAEAVERTSGASGSSSARTPTRCALRLVADWWAARDPDGARDDRAPPRRRRRSQRSRACADAGRRRARRRRAVDAGGRRSPSAIASCCAATIRALGVVNGDRGVVVAVDRRPKRLTVELALRGARRSGRGYLEQPTRHGARRSSTATRSPVTSRRA